MGWSAGWVVNETNRGIQWWTTPSEDWEQLSAPFGDHRRQRDEAFAAWYQSILEEWSRSLGKPFDLESIHWRRMDLPAVGRRTTVEQENWWRADIEVDRRGTWRLIFPAGFIDCFEEATATIQPPWTFDEVWGKLGPTGREELLQWVSRQSGARTHLAALVVEGTLKRRNVVEKLPRTPREDVQDEIERRNEMLRELGQRATRQTLSSWSSDAVSFLTSRLGEGLMEGALAGESWRSYAEQWKQFEQEKLERRVGTEIWARKWNALNPEEWKFIVPRLPVEDLEMASVGLPPRMLSKFSQHLSRKLDPDPSSPRLRVYRARSRLMKRIKQLASNIDEDVVRRWNQA